MADVDCGSESQIYSEQAKNEYFKDGVELTRMNTKLQPNTNPAKNVVLFLGKSTDQYVELDMGHYIIIFKPIFSPLPQTFIARKDY